MRCATTLFLVLVIPAWLGAQEDCADGLVYDDGTFENGYGASLEQGDTASEYVMRIDPPPNARGLEKICVCWTKNGADSSVVFDLNFYAVAQDGTPGALLASHSTAAFGVPSFSGHRFYAYDLRALLLPADEPLFIGPSWDPGLDERLFICADEDGPSSQTGYHTKDIATGGPDRKLGEVDAWVDYRNLGVRALYDVTCFAGAETLCLNDNRFKVELEWSRPNGSEGRGQAVSVEGREDSGLFWFFDEGNLEMLVKVLDACGSSFDSYWVFYAATTNVYFKLTITDTVTDVVKIYENPLGMAATPVQDTQAFKTCS